MPDASAAAASCAPFDQRVCAGTELERSGVQVAQLAASWCERVNPFVAPRPIAQPAGIGGLVHARCTPKRSNASESVDDDCAMLASVATAELSVNCTASPLAGGTRGLLCAGGEARVSLALQLLGTADGELIIVDAPSQAIASPPVRALPSGRGLRFLHAVSLLPPPPPLVMFPSGDATSTRNATAARNESSDGAVMVLAGDARTLRAYVVRSSDGSEGGGYVTVVARACDDGAPTSDWAREGLSLVGVTIAPPTAGGTAFAVLLLQRGSSGGEHELRTYLLHAGTARCSVGGTIVAVSSAYVASDVGALPVSVQLLGVPPRAHAPVRRRVHRGAGDATPVAANAASAALDALHGALGLGDEDGGSDGPSANASSASLCDSRELLVVHDRHSVHVFRPCALRGGERLELRTAGLSRSRSLVHVAEAGTALTAVSGFFEHFARPSRAVGGSPLCLTRHATRVEACVGGSNCTARRVSARFCSAFNAEEGAPDEACTSADGERSGDALLWLVAATAPIVGGSVAARGGTVHIVPLPEVGGWGVGGDGASAHDASVWALPAAHCGLPSEDPSFHLNWYWAREEGAEVVCEARVAREIALPLVALDVSVRFRRLAPYSPSGVSGLRGVVSSAAEHPCDLLLSRPTLSFLYESCTQQASAASAGVIGDENDWLRGVEGAGVSESQRLALRTSMHHALFIRLAPNDTAHERIDGGLYRSVPTGRTSRMLVYGVQERLFTSWGMVVESLNALVVPGLASSMHVSLNGMFAWLVVSRQRWELASVQRSTDLCDAYRARPDDPYLSRMGLDEACTGGLDDGDNARGGGGGVSLFGWESTACPVGAMCPSFVSEAVYPAELIAPGLHVDRAYAFATCAAGSFCVGGQQLACPPGFMCAEAGLAAPVACRAAGEEGSTLSCFDERHSSGVVVPTPCAADRICVVPYAPGLPLPPGYTRSNASVLRRCRVGEWCPLGRTAHESTEELLCPPASYCTSPDVLTPKPCNFTLSQTTYCPAGTSVERTCPAGYACGRPDEMQPCSPRSYCPEGTLFEAPCPAGRYCPNASVAMECPAGSTCPEGALRPRACLFLTTCPAGSSAEVYSLRAPLIVLLACLLVVVYGCTSRRRSHGGRSPGLTRIARLLQHGRRSSRVGSGTRRSDGGMEFTPFTDETDVRGKEASAAPAAERMAEMAVEEEAAAAPVAEVADAAEGQVDGRGVDVRFHELSVHLQRVGRTVLDRAHGGLRRGELSAVMGPSGSGKTTLLMALAGRIPYRGVVRVDGVSASRGLSGALGRAFALVPQEDVMYRRLSVAENVWLSAAFRLAAGSSRGGGTGDAVRRVLGWMRLEHVQHTTVGDEEVRGVSGGERKRVNIALELVADPSCLFVDEPTSGLDASAAKEVIECIRDIVRRKGITVACVVHQPRHEVMVAFDSLLLLAKGGRIVYGGAPLAASAMYAPLGVDLPAMCSLSDFLLDVVSDPANGVAMAQLWEARLDVAASSDGAADGAPLASASGREVARGVSAGYLRQLMLCTTLHFKLRYRHVGTPLLELVVISLVAALIGLRYAGRAFIGPLPDVVQQSCPLRLKPFCALPQKDENGERLTLSLIMLSLLGVLSGAAFFARDVAVVKRYQSWGVSMAVYATCGLFVHLLEIVVAPVVFCAVNGQLASFLSSGDEMFAVMFGAYWTASSIGYVVIACVGSAHQARIVGPMVVLFNFVISPAASPLPQLPAFVRPLTKLSYLRWAMEAGYLLEIEHWDALYDTSSAVAFMGYSRSNVGYGLHFIMWYGLIFRILMIPAFVYAVPRRGRG